MTPLYSLLSLCVLDQGSPTPGYGPVLVCGLLGTRLHSRRWVVGFQQAKLHLCLQLLSITHITTWVLPPVRSAVAWDSHRSLNPTVNYACNRARLCAPYENLMPDDMRWSWGSDATAGKWLQIQIITNREVWLHRDYPETIPPTPSLQSLEKLSFTKLVSGAKKRLETTVLDDR